MLSCTSDNSVIFEI
uniref:Uncharacterized protein n=1 Tax=Rhizophora mucronata TaxID=61149 RepID=A0A2P2R1Z4_RHIMU